MERENLYMFQNVGSKTQKKKKLTECCFQFDYVYTSGVDEFEIGNVSRYQNVYSIEWIRVKFQAEKYAKI